MSYLLLRISISISLQFAACSMQHALMHACLCPLSFVHCPQSEEESLIVSSCIVYLYIYAVCRIIRNAKIPNMPDANARCQVQVQDDAQMMMING
ncbi:hypothetical protein FisN_28Lu118 [Fistulifera solaris]|uniref:Uncharacterized protein n=1 Tax=Fistulifera solaris TaxID=1519565 RepID=A0A1Z5K547_FISSO|nr:hypothetical protein FisN_28Lu118 [Fistulifera solaris]|eukprot:GAX21383.1 hypothetical protein FisN_28Lu118 [Fistulifera solaris]